MIYCPRCKRPSSKNTGSCPHCGHVLGEVSLSETRPSDAAAPSTGVRRFDGDMALESDNDAAPLELAIDDDFSHQRSRAGGPSNEVSISVGSGASSRAFFSGGNSGPALADAFGDAETAAQIDAIAQFGPCKTGIIGTMKYGLHVHQRLPQLRVETDAVRKEKEQSWASLQSAKARLGRASWRDRLKTPQLEKLMARAIKADNRLEGVSRHEDMLTRQYEQKRQAVDEKINVIEKELMPFTLEAQKNRAQFNEISKNRARLQAKIKRTEIELRNVRELIEKKQTAYADLNRPKDERAQLLHEIADVDKRQPPLLHRLTEEQRALAGTDAPLESISAEWQQLEGTLKEFNDQILQEKKERNDLASAYEAALREIHDKAKGESQQALDAWAAVGETVYVNKMMNGDALEAVGQAAQQFFKVQEKLNLYEDALCSYNKKACALAKKYWIVAGAIAGVLLIALLSVIIF